MSFDYERVIGPTQPGTVTGSLGGPAAGQRWIVKQILLANTTALPATVTLGIDGTAAADQIIPGFTIQGNSLTVVDMSQVIDDGEEVHGLQGTSAAITVTISATVES